MSNYQHERGWLDSEVWGNKPYCERAAWSWMIGEANFSDGIKNIKGNPVQIKRGEFTASIRFMAEKFSWNKGKIERFLQKLSKWNMILIRSENGTGQNIITICNYSKYQNKNGKSETETGRKPRQKRDRSETEARQTINPSNPSSPSSPIFSLSILDVSDWLSEKRSEGKYIDIDEYELLEKFKDYCLSKNPKYKDYVAAFRNSFKWKDAPRKSNTTKGNSNGKLTPDDELQRYMDRERQG